MRSPQDFTKGLIQFQRSLNQGSGHTVAGRLSRRSACREDADERRVLLLEGEADWRGAPQSAQVEAGDGVSP
jgi:hypothetical protein